MRLALFSLVMLSLAAVLLSAQDPTQWRVLTSGVETNLRGISASGYDEREPIVLWASGSNGVILRSADSGKEWHQLHIPGAERADFRAIQSFNINVAYVASVGDKGASKIFKTRDAGITWSLQYSDPRQDFFLDGLVCRTEKDCFAITDPLDGKFLLLHTDDGEHWKELPREQMPAALPQEGVFAASNSALTLCGDSDVFFGTGGPAARVFHSRDNGKTWTAIATPILSGSASSGIFSLHCSANAVIAVGGDYRKTSDSARVAAYSTDRAETWKLADRGPAGFRSAIDTISGEVWIAVGPTGADTTTSHGVNWTHAGSFNLNALTVFGDHHFFAVGAKGTVATLFLYVLH